MIVHKQQNHRDHDHSSDNFLLDTARKCNVQLIGFDNVITVQEN